MFRSIFFRLVAFIFRPMDAWDALSHKKVTGNEAFLAHFLYPIIGLIALAAFAGVLFAGREFDFVIALKSSIKAIAASLGGFFLASYLMNELWGAWMKRERNMLLFVLQIILSFFPDLAFLWIPALYTIYIVWAGAVNYLKVDGEVQMKFTGIASLIIIGAPTAISLLLFMLMPGLRF